MLFKRWNEIATAFANQVALRDVARGETWTFGEMAAAVNGPLHSPAREVIFPQGVSGEFIFSVLRAWRNGHVVCPLEPGQPRPPMGAELPEQIVHFKTTSATTGHPRLVAFTSSQLAADAENIVNTMGLRRDWPNLGVISLAHSYGFSNLVLPLLLHGIPLILGGSGLPEAVRRAAEGLGAVTLSGVPALWRSWEEADAIPPNVRLAISAGASLPPSLEAEIFAQRGLKVHNFYGSTECGGIAYDDSADPRREGSYTGKPMRNVNVSVAEDGCLEVRGPAVGETYWPEPEPTLRGGIFHTSDIAEIRSSGVYLVGRASDQINVAGRKVSPEMIEKVLAAHTSVRECLAFGIPSPDVQRGETIVVCVVVNGDARSETLKEFLMTRLPAWQIPRDWWFLDSIHASSRGKLSRAEWRKRYLQRASRED